MILNENPFYLYATRKKNYKSCEKSLTHKKKISPGERYFLLK